MAAALGLTRSGGSGGCGLDWSYESVPTWITLSCGRLCTEFDLRCQGHFARKLVPYKLSCLQAA